MFYFGAYFNPLIFAIAFLNHFDLFPAPFISQFLRSCIFVNLGSLSGILVFLFSLRGHDGEGRPYRSQGLIVFTAWGLASNLAHEPQYVLNLYFSIFLIFFNFFLKSSLIILVLFFSYLIPLQYPTLLYFESTLVPCLFHFLLLIRRFLYIFFYQPFPHFGRVTSGRDG